jgi:iron complex outermembrane receptor protein
MNPRMTKLSIALMQVLGVGLAAGVVALPAMAQQPASKERIEVTGSNIKRVEGESALPVTVITREEIQNSGVTTVQDILDRLPTNMSFGSFNEAGGEGSALVGFTGASLRGFGTNRTLVLINGKRVAPYALSNQIGGGADLSAIPVSVIERVEILKDGASAVYGTDAIAGVINFILRKDFRGIEATGSVLDTEHGGARQTRFSGSIGMGDLSKDRFNIFFTADHLKQDPLKASQRPFSDTAYLPALGYDRTSGNSLPANISQPGGFSGTRNPTIPFPGGASSTSCIPPFSFPTAGSPFQCRFDFASVIETIPNFTKDNFMGRAAIQLAPNHQAFVEASYYKGVFDQRISPTPAGAGDVQESLANATLSPSSPFYPTAYIASLPNGNIHLPVLLSWRTLELGPRWDEAKVNQSRFVAGLQGLIANWDYSTSLNYTENQQTDTYKGGYVSENGLGALIQNGTVNPFGFNTPAALAAMQATQILGDASKNKAKNYGWDAKISNELMQLPGGPLAVALGVDYRKEKLDLINSAFLSSGDVWGGAGAIPSLTGVDRTVSAVFGEVNVPILRNLEMNVAARLDHYSDFGSTTNPKVTLRWTPTRELLLRAAYGTGFRAPTLYDLFQPFLITNTAGSYDDPLRCPTTGLVTDCNLQFNAKQGGNAALQPEKSKQWYAGLVWEPNNQMSVGVDYFKIYIRNLITAISDSTIFSDFARYAPTQVVRGPVDPHFPNLPGPILFVLENTVNVGKQSTSGVDVDLTYRFPSTSVGRVTAKYNATYTLSWKQQTFDSTDYPDFVGQGGSLTGFQAIPRYRHYATIDWNSGPWGATLAQNFQDSYKEADFVTGGERRVAPYEIYDIQGRWSGMKNLTLKLGIRNLLDRAPPLSNQENTFQAGYDPSYGDPRGRMYYGTITVSFK